MSDEQDEVQRLRLEAAMRRVYAKGRCRLRWWKHAREYVSLLRLVKKGLLRDERRPMDGSQQAKDGLPQHPPLPTERQLTAHEQAIDKFLGTLPTHPPWNDQGWRWNTPDGKAPFRY